MHNVSQNSVDFMRRYLSRRRLLQPTAYAAVNRINTTLSNPEDHQVHLPVSGLGQVSAGKVLS